MLKIPFSRTTILQFVMLFLQTSKGSVDSTLYKNMDPSPILDQMGKWFKVQLGNM